MVTMKTSMLQLVVSKPRALAVLLLNLLLNLCPVLRFRPARKVEAEETKVIAENGACCVRIIREKSA